MVSGAGFDDVVTESGEEESASGIDCGGVDCGEDDVPSGGGEEEADEAALLVSACPPRMFCILDNRDTSLWWSRMVYSSPKRWWALRYSPCHFFALGTSLSFELNVRNGVSQYATGRNDDATMHSKTTGKNTWKPDPIGRLFIVRRVESVRQHTETTGVLLYS